MENIFSVNFGQDGHTDCGSLENGLTSSVFDIISKHIDEEIHRNYLLYPNNYIALDMISGTDAFCHEYTTKDKECFMGYLNAQLAKIDNLPNKDEAFLMQQLLTMYANPAVNYLAAR